MKWRTLSSRPCGSSSNARELGNPAPWASAPNSSRAAYVRRAVCVRALHPCQSAASSSLVFLLGKLLRMTQCRTSAFPADFLLSVVGETMHAYISDDESKPSIQHLRILQAARLVAYSFQSNLGSSMPFASSKGLLRGEQCNGDGKSSLHQAQTNSILAALTPIRRNRKSSVHQFKPTLSYSYLYEQTLLVRPRLSHLPLTSTVS